jgi:hypothetical protein
LDLQFTYFIFFASDSTSKSDTAAELLATCGLTIDVAIGEIEGFLSGNGEINEHRFNRNLRVLFGNKLFDAVVKNL